MMKPSSRIPPEIISYCDRYAEGLAELTTNRERIDVMKDLLPELLRDKQLFHRILHDLIERGEYPDLRYATMFDSEYILYTHPGHLFSLRMFIWKPGTYDPIHDHNSWGVIGPVIGHLEVINYRRIDNGSQEGHARLVETNRQTIQPGDTYFVLPLNDGIHKTGNPTAETIIQVSIYGEGQAKRDHINGFNLETNITYPIFAPKIKKKHLAMMALSCLDSQ
ncbi:MAG TPA: hypothetical protein ENO00_11010 [Deltaproteobacteria bacterium]|nr:hypothetical protein [Deltaproteobacteria bacterium]